MSDAPTSTDRPVGTRITVASAAVTTLVVVALVGPAVERLREEAAQAQRGNALSRVVLAAAPARAGDWSPAWDGPESAVPDYPVALPDSLAYFASRDGRDVPLTTAPPLARDHGGEPFWAAPVESSPEPGYLPNWDLFEPVGVRQTPPVRRARAMPEKANLVPTESATLSPTPPPPGILPLPTSIDVAVPIE